MAISGLNLVLTGGASNQNPRQSLGGEPSFQPLIGTFNNLFENINVRDGVGGKTDYRCIYLFNDSPTSNIQNLLVFVREEIAYGANIELGVKFANEVQEITVSGTASGGSFDIDYDGTTRTVNYNPNMILWGNNLETQLNSIPDVSATVSTSGSIFTITFSDYKRHPLLVLDNNLVDATVDIEKTTPGYPINTTPVLIEKETTAPYNIPFSYPTESEPFEIGNLLPGEGLPIWVKRSIPPDTGTIVEDGFTLGISCLYLT